MVLGLSFSKTLAEERQVEEKEAAGLGCLMTIWTKSQTKLFVFGVLL